MPNPPRRLTRTPTPEEKRDRPWNVVLLRSLQPDGSLLWGERMSLPFLRELYISGGSALFNAIYMQDPSGLAGDIFKPEWFQAFVHRGFTEQTPSVTEPGRLITMTAQDLLDEGKVQFVLEDLREWVSLEACDLAVKQKETADFYARVNVFASRHGDLCIEDVYQARLTETDMVADMTNAGRKYKAKAIGVESVTFQALVFRMAVRGSHLPFVELDPAGRDKVIRARPLAARYQALKVYHRYGAPWRQPFEFQLAAFPGGRWDDMTDAAAFCHELAAKYTPGQYRTLATLQEEMRKEGRLTGGILPPSS